MEELPKKRGPGRPVGTGIKRYVDEIHVKVTARQRRTLRRLALAEGKSEAQVIRDCLDGLRQPADEEEQP